AVVEALEHGRGNGEEEQRAEVARRRPLEHERDVGRDDREIRESEREPLSAPATASTRAGTNRFPDREPHEQQGETHLAPEAHEQREVDRGREDRGGGTERKGARQ